MIYFQVYAMVGASISVVYTGVYLDSFSASMVVLGFYIFLIAAVGALIRSR